MAQKLKDDVRQAIIEAAKQEFLEKGYEEASMRSIAAKADITVGNIYRYFDNKEDLNKQILAQTGDDITKMLNGLKIERVSRQTRVFDVVTENKDINAMLDEFVEKIVSLSHDKPSEFNIILHNSELNSSIRDWFKSTISSLIYQKYSYLDQRTIRELLIEAYSAACYAGLLDIFEKARDDEYILKETLKNYLHRFFAMVNEEKANGSVY
ncbi:MAG: TetR/AcrR family transcriptional regulator [Erysipelotrichaceae bacterium]|nr:TetR/AcrR family transcriptional regulator [Erysipelotrichaceae bacterium]